MQTVRFWVTLALAALTTTMAVVTVYTPDWIERLAGDTAGGDAGDGSTERWLVAILAACSVWLLRSARDLWRTHRLGLTGAG